MRAFTRQIAVTYRCAMRYREKQLADTGLGGCQTPYLTALYRRPGLTQEELAQELDVNKSSVTRQVAMLEEKGYVYRMSDEGDRRVLRVYPTEKALVLRERLYQVLRDWNAYLTGDFTEEERETLARLMQRVSERAEAWVREQRDATGEGGWK